MGTQILQVSFICDLPKQAAEPIKGNPSTRKHLTLLRKQSQQKQIDDLLATIHTCTICLLMYVVINGGEICVLKWCMYKTNLVIAIYKFRVLLYIIVLTSLVF